MKFYKFVEELRKLHPNKIIMIKVGAFFNSIGKDAIVLEHKLGLKRTCFAKGICKTGIPAVQIKESLEEIKNKLKDKNLGIIIYDEVKNERYKYKNRYYDVILELDGSEIEEERNNTNCNSCKNNIYEKNKNVYKINKESYYNLVREIEEISEMIKRTENLKIKKED